MHFKFILSILLLFNIASRSEATTRLMLMGGGEYSPAGIAEFVSWAGQTKSRVLVVNWGFDELDAAHERFKTALEPHHPAAIDSAPTPGTAGFSADILLEGVRNATAIFFTGGDQVMIMERISQVQGLRELFTERFLSGTPFGGSSAGTAIMAEVMPTGGGDFTVIHPHSVETAMGLGFTRGLLVDQHFVVRSRENRLFSLLFRKEHNIGLGIDEGSALALVDNHLARNLGPGLVLAMHRPGRMHRIVTDFMQAGDQIDLSSLAPKGKH